MDRVVYPLMRRAGFELKPMQRITIGFALASLSLAYAAIVQHLIYSAGPCYKDPLNCDAVADIDHPVPNHVHIAVQTPAYVFIGVSEIFISVTGLEYAYTKAPPSMKSFVQSLYLLTNAFGSALSETLVPGEYLTAVQARRAIGSPPTFSRSRRPLLTLRHTLKMLISSQYSWTPRLFGCASRPAPVRSERSANSYTGTRVSPPSPWAPP